MSDFAIISGLLALIVCVGLICFTVMNVASINSNKPRRCRWQPGE